MLRELYAAALGMVPQLMRLEVVANNLANLSTLGYRRELLFQRALIEAQQNLLHVPGEAESADVPVASSTDFRPGALQQTGHPLDVALEGPGFFVVEDALGQLFLTRRGRFLIGSDGTLTTPEGKRVLGAGGVPLQLPLEHQSATGSLSAPVEITPEGELRVGSFVVGSFWVVAVAPEGLRRSNGVEFALSANVHLQSLQPGEYRLVQGFVEGSNVNPVEELVQLIELQRHFELGQRVIRTGDSTLERSISIARLV